MGLDLHQHDSAAATATGAAECIAMHSGQWSASLSSGCKCATCTTASSAIRTRHTTVAAGKAPGLRRPSPRICACNPVNQEPLLQEYTIMMDALRRMKVSSGLIMKLRSLRRSSDHLSLATRGISQLEGYVSDSEEICRDGRIAALLHDADLRPAKKFSRERHQQSRSSCTHTAAQWQARVYIL